MGKDLALTLVTDFAPDLVNDLVTDSDSGLFSDLVPDSVLDSAPNYFITIHII
jgi:hypothetical protein